MGCVMSSLPGGGRSQHSQELTRLMKRYLPRFTFPDPSTSEDRVVALAHWDQVYKETVHSDIHGDEESPIGKLFEAFYAILFHDSPHLVPIFQANQNTKGRVLVHIATGMTNLLLAEDLIARVANLAVFHIGIGIKPEDFDPLGEAFIQSMRVTSGKVWCDAVELAWRRIYGHAAVLILSHIPRQNMDFADFDG